MFKELKFNMEARESMKQGIDILANAVKVTLGPKGRSVIIGKNSIPHVTKDGVTVAKEINLRDPFQNVGAQLIKEVASKTCADVGDGTTTATILAQSIIDGGMQFIKDGYNPIKLKKEIEDSLKEVVKFINSKSVQIAGDNNKIKQIATISANNDESIGELIANAFEKITEDGVIVVEESKNNETSVEIINGMHLSDRGFIAPHFITNIEKNETVLENCKILITDQKIHSIRDILPILEATVEAGDALLIMAQEYDGDVLENLKMNVLNGNIKVVPIKAPNFGDYRKQIMSDIAVLTNGIFVSYDSGMDIKDVIYSDLGQCEKVVVKKESTTIIGGKGDRENINKQVNHIRDLLSKMNEENEYLEEFYKERIAKLIGGVAIIKVGGTTEIEMRERKDRIDDSVAATKAAIEEGFVIGGGLTYLQASNEMGLETEGAQLIFDALREPFVQILYNAGMGDEVDSIMKKIFIEGRNIGFNAKTEIIEDLFQAGVVDPTKVSRLALENSVSIATLFLTTECIIVPEQVITMI